MAQPEPIPLALHPFKGLCQTLVALLLTLLVTAICWSLWAYIAHRRLAAQIAAITALHQPFWESDYARTRIPDDQNAAPLWRAAFAALPANDTCPSASNFTFNDYPPFSSQWNQLEDQSIEDNAKLFALVHQAAAKEADWGQVNPLQPSPDFGRARAVANILADSVLHAHLHGNDALAIQRWHDLTRLALSERNFNILVGRLVGVGIQALGNERLLCIAPDLVIAGDSSTQAVQGQTVVSRGEVQSLIQTLLDESRDAQKRAQVTDRERICSHEIFLKLKAGQIMLGPLIDLSDARVLFQRGVDRLAVAAPSASAAALVYNSVKTPALGSLRQPIYGPGEGPCWAGIFEDWSGSLSRYVNVEWRVVADRRCTALALAIRLYRIDHKNAWPAALCDLVPDYLPSIPEDPFALTPSPIGYIICKSATADVKVRPMLCFGAVGDPAALPPPANPVFSWMWNRGHTESQWRDLSRWYPVARATTPSSP